MFEKILKPLKPHTWPGFYENTQAFVNPNLVSFLVIPITNTTTLMNIVYVYDQCSINPLSNQKDRHQDL